MNLGVLKESRDGETRVALIPNLVEKVKAKGYDVLVQSGAGEIAGVSDAEFQEAGATVVPDAASIVGDLHP